MKSEKFKFTISLQALTIKLYLKFETSSLHKLDQLNISWLDSSVYGTLLLQSQRTFHGKSERISGEWKQLLSKLS